MDTIRHFLYGSRELTEQLAQPRTQGIILLIGVGLLALALIVLMMTRWGQVKPLSKCIVLSVFAHFLLMVYAYSAKLFLEPPLPPQEKVFNLTIVSTDDEPAEHEAVTERQPWNAIVSDAPSLPDFTDPARPAIDLPQPERLFQDDPIGTEVPDISDPVADHLPTVVPEQPPPDAAPQLVQRAPAPPLDATPIETPQRKAVPEEASIAPDTNDLERVQPPSTTVEMTDVAEPNMLANVLQDTAGLQRLSDLAVHDPLANAVVGNQDETEQTSNNGNGSGSINARGDHPNNLVPVPLPLAAVTRPATLDISDAAITPSADGDGSDLPALYQSRQGAGKEMAVQRFGGNRQTEAAVAAALDWLAANQSQDGRWDANVYGGGREERVLGHERGGAGAQADTGVTGLALLAFLAAGHTHLDGKFQETLQHGLEFLLRSQTRDGNLAGEARLFARMYCHGMASLAISEAYAITGDDRLRPFVLRAVQYTVNAQNPHDGGWRYQPGDAGDMSQFGWQVMALKSAELAGVRTPAETRAGMIRFVNNSATGPYKGLAGYRPLAPASRTMTAEAVVCRAFLGLEQRELAAREAVDFIMAEPPQAGKMNLYYWYYATLAMFQMQGPKWEEWNAALQQQLLSKQQRFGAHTGSWDPDTVWGGYGGRVYSTAMATLCLEVYYRYLPIYEKP